MSNQPPPPNRTITMSTTVKIKPQVIVISSYDLPRPLPANARIEPWEEICRKLGKGNVYVNRNHWTERGEACKRAWKVEVCFGRFHHSTFSTHLTVDAAIKSAEKYITRNNSPVVL